MAFINIPGMTWKEPVAAQASLPTAGNVDGDARVTLDNSHLFIWDGSAWNDISGGGGGGITIGDAVTDGDPSSVLYIDATGQLAQDADFLFDTANHDLTIGEFSIRGSAVSAGSFSYGGTVYFGGGGTLGMYMQAAMISYPGMQNIGVLLGTTHYPFSNTSVQKLHLGYDQADALASVAAGTIKAKDILTLDSTNVVVDGALSSITLSGDGGEPSIYGNTNFSFGVSSTEMLRLFDGAGGLVQIRNNLSNQNTSGDGNVGMFGAYNTTADPVVLPFKYGWIGEKFMIGATTGSGSTYIPNYTFDLRASASATAVYQQFTIPTTTGTTSSDGTKEGLDSSGNFEIVNQEAGKSIGFTTTDAGVELDTSGTKPTAGSTYRGQLFLERGGAGVADILYMCMKDAADAYSWVVVKSA